MENIGLLIVKGVGTALTFIVDNILEEKRLMKLVDKCLKERGL